MYMADDPAALQEQLEEQGSEEHQSAEDAAHYSDAQDPGTAEGQENGDAVGPSDEGAGPEELQAARGASPQEPYDEAAHTHDMMDEYQGVGPGGQSQGQSGKGTPSHGRGPTGDDSDDDMPFVGRLEELTMRARSAGSSHKSRPGSAVINLRGSRPNSALVAQEIEGFEDDFMERVDEEQEDVYEEYDDMQDNLGPTVEELIERAQMEQLRLLEGNDILQKRVRSVLDFRNRGRPQVARDLSKLDGAATRYRSALKQWIDVLEERDRVEAHYQTSIFDMKATLEERIKRADDISKAYKHFRLEVAKSAEHSKTGRTINDKLLAQLEQEDNYKEEEVQRVRLKNIHLTNQLKRIEQSLRQKEELAEGLHLIDFEQLKIENQSLNEKIEERNEELLKLKKKTTTTVQILTHVREKLQCIEKDNTGLQGQLEDLEHQLSDKRDSLGRAKAGRDTLRQKARKIKESSVYITNSSLLTDIEAQKEKKDKVISEIEGLREEYANLADTITKANTKLMSLAEEAVASGNVPAQALQQSMKRMQSTKSLVGRA